MISLPYHKGQITLVLNKYSRPRGECKVWTADYDKFGVPCIRIHGAIFHVIKVHWWLKHGYKPLWKSMKQKCKTPFCMNTDHFTDDTPIGHRRAELVVFQFNKPTFSPVEDAAIWERFQYGEKKTQLAKWKKVDPSTITKAINRHQRIIDSE